MRWKINTRLAENTHPHQERREWQHHDMIEYGATVEDNFLDAVKDFRLGWRFIFQQGNNPKLPTPYVTAAHLKSRSFSQKLSIQSDVD